MKTLELELNRRLLIVEYETVDDMDADYLIYKAYPKDNQKVLCRVNDLKEGMLDVKLDMFFGAIYLKQAIKEIQLDLSKCIIYEMV